MQRGISGEVDRGPGGSDLLAFTYGRNPGAPGAVERNGERRGAPVLLTPIVYAGNYTRVTVRQKLGNEALAGRSARSLQSNPALYLASRECGPTQIGQRLA